MALTVKQTNFCNYYIELGNASEAYRRAYNAVNMKPETITSKAYELLQRDDFKAMIKGLQDKNQAKHDYTQDEAIKQLTTIARCDISEFVEWDGNVLSWKPFEDLTKEQKSCIESVKMTRDGLELKIYGKVQTIERISKMLGFEAAIKNELKADVKVGIINIDPLNDESDNGTD